MWYNRTNFREEYMFIQFNSAISPSGFVSFEEAHEAYNEVKKVRSDAKLLISDVNSVLAAPDFEQYCRTNGIDFAIGTTVILEDEFGLSTLNLVANGADGVRSISKLLSKINEGVRDVSTHRFSVEDLRDCLSDVLVISDENSPRFLAEKKGGEVAARMVNKILGEVGVRNHVFKDNVYSEAVINSDPKLKTYQHQIQGSKYKVPVISFHTFKNRDLAFSEFLFNKATPRASDDTRELITPKYATFDSLDFDRLKQPYESNQIQLKDVSYDQDITANKMSNAFTFIDDAWRKLDARYPENHMNSGAPHPLRARAASVLSHELETVERHNFGWYFESVHRFTMHCKRQNIDFMGRGSVNNSFLGYLLEMLTDGVEPFEQNAVYSRFLGARATLPDIDIEFGADIRPDVFRDYCTSTGNEAAGIVTISLYKKFKSTLAVSYEFLGIDDQEQKLLERQMISYLGSIGIKNIERRFAKLNISEVEEAIKVSGVEIPEKIKQVIESTIRLRGQLSQCTIHNSKQHVLGQTNEMFPTIELGGMKVSLLAHYNCERLGVVPFDILSSQMLVDLRNIKEAYARHGIQSDDVAAAFMGKSPYFDELISDLQNSNFMINQLSSSYASKIIEKIKPKNALDLVLIFGLIRLDGDNQNQSLEVTNEEKQFFADPDIAEIVSRSRSLLIYDEQLLQIADKVAGLAGVDADTLRRSIVKDKPKALDDLRDRFISGAVDNGRSLESATAIFNHLKSYTGKYFFCEGHAKSYVALALKQLAIKDKTPALFYQHSVIGHGDGKSSNNTYFIEGEKVSKKQSFVLDGVAEYHRRGFEFVLPNVNRSASQDFWQQGLNGKVIVPSLTSTGVDLDFALAASKVRVSKRITGGYKSVVDFIDSMNYEFTNNGRTDYQTVIKNTLKLAKMGALDGLPLSQNMDLSSIQDLVLSRSIVSKFIAEYQRCNLKNESFSTINLQLTDADILSRKSLIHDELTSYGFTKIVEIKNLPIPSVTFYKDLKRSNVGLKNS